MPTPETMKGMGTSFRRNDFWDCLAGQALCTYDWLPLMPSTNHITNACPPRRFQSLYSFLLEFLKWEIVRREKQLRDLSLCSLS